MIVNPVPGDRVQVVQTDNMTAQFAKKIGVISKIIETNEPNIGVKFDNEWSVFFYPIELEKINP